MTDWIDVPFTGDFDLSASARFIEGFVPAGEVEVGRGGEIPLAFPSAPSWRPVGALVRQDEPNGTVKVRVDADPEDVPYAVEHVRRILSLDVDGSGFPDIADRDPVVGTLQAKSPGMRPVLFNSPYEAACWSVLSQRVRMTDAAALKARIARRVGGRAAVPAAEGELSGIQLDTFPAPRRLIELPRVPLVPEVKDVRLRAVAEAALAGDLDADHLRSMPASDALKGLARIPGIGAFSAELILLRGAGHPDVLATAEPRLHARISAAYGLDNPSVADLERVAEPWRPYRTWVGVMFRALT